MRAVVSRVSTAAVTVDGEVVGEIGPGLLSLVGVGREDDEAAARALARKIHELRIFPSEDGAVSAADLGLPVLVVSQFTLYADTRKGRRPSWQAAATGDVAEPLIDTVVEELRRPRLHGRHGGLRRPHAGQLRERGPDDAAAGDLSAPVNYIAAYFRVVGRPGEGKGA